MSFYDKMFSTLGFKTLNVLLGVDDETLIEEEKKQLTHLILLMAKDAELKAKVDEVINSDLDDQNKLDSLFLLEKKARID
ncbi:hypothetical protein [Robertmurraya korlensis]|uniref:hypothetical protein n=1 Tax=Robertmurraya korlensis TaxID=519977 RepID=UPI000823F95C|nr:hypothetical protein [Robertmurraya korlensis]